MIFNKVYPDISNNSDLCIICMDENKSTITHHCPVCVKDSWKACDECMNELNKCPVCRTPFNPINPIIPLNQIIINININDNMPNPINQDNYFNPYALDLKKILIRTAILLILGTYLGKFITYIFCSCVCNSDQCEEYGCRPYIQSSYWKKVFGLETILGILIIIIGKIWINKLRN